MKRKPIDKQLLKSWRLVMYDTTYEAIRTKTGLSKPTIGLAIKKGTATQDTINKLTTFFNEFKIPA